jgi:uncharacterized protein (DUF362 family)
MPKFTRRDFLRLMALALGSVAVERYLSACSPRLIETQQLIIPTTERPNPTATTVTSSAETIPTEASASAPDATPASIPDLVVARNGEPETLVRRAVEALGGMGKFVSQGANVVVKPNICVAYHSFEYAATTNPWVVGTVVKLCYEAGAASVKVMDYPFGGSTQEAYAKSGIQEQVQVAGGEMASMSGFKYVSTAIPLGVRLKKTDVFDDILNADVLIDVPIAKHHSSARLTIGMKNLMGAVRNRSALHINLGQCIADLNTLLRPQLTIVDAIRILMANGPTGGDLNDVKELDTIIASADIVAADSYATTLFGLQPEDIPYIKAGTAMGLGRSDLANLKIEEISGT